MLGILNKFMFDYIRVMIHRGIPANTCLTKTTAAQNEDALCYHRVRGLYFMAVVFVRSTVAEQKSTWCPFIIVKLHYCEKHVR